MSKKRAHEWCEEAWQTGYDDSAVAWESVKKKPKPSNAWSSWGCSEEQEWESWAPPAGAAMDWRIGTADKADIEHWLECTPIGQNVPGTPIIPVKTPFEGVLADKAYQAGLLPDDQWFGKAELLKACKAQNTPIGLVIDMVNTDKYYTGFCEGEGKIEYHKVRIPGRTVPERSTLEQIFDTIDEFVERRPTKYVAVHCTHGVNRTGFLVAAYLMTRGGVTTRKKAVKEFEKARGMKMDKEYLFEALDRLEVGEY